MIAKSFTFITIFLSFSLLGCAPKNINALRNHSAGTLYAHSNNTLGQTYQRAIREMRGCTSVTVGGDYVANAKAVNLSLLVGNKVTVNAHLIRVQNGTDSTINYWIFTWRGRAKKLQKIINGEKPNC